MSFTSSTNRWASRLVIVLQLTTWSAVSVVLLQKGVSSLQRRMLETTSHVSVESIQSENHITEIDQRSVDSNLEDKNTSSKVLRIARDKEHIILDNRSSKIIETREDIIMRPELVSEPVSLEEEESNSNVTRKEIDILVENASRSTTRGKTGGQVASTLGKSKSRMSFSRMSDGGATTAIAMVVIGAIMLLLGPAVIVLRILDERKQARKLVALSAIAREDLPPAYEQVVFMSEAPRYSTLSLNDDYSSPPSSAAALIKSNSA